jgi:hypothetical protein
MSRNGITIAVVEAIKRRADERARKRVDVPAGDGGRILRYPSAFFLVAGWIGLLFFLAMGLLIWFSDETAGAKLFYLVQTAIMALMCLLLLNEHRAVAWIDSEGIGAKSPWRWRSVELRWEEVTELRWCGRTLMWYRIRGAGGTIRVHAWLGGRLIEDYFAKHLTEEIACEAVAEANSVKSYEWQEFWGERVKEAERIEE